MGDKYHYTNTTDLGGASVLASRLVSSLAPPQYTSTSTAAFSAASTKL